MTRYERGWRDGIAAAVKFLREARISPEDAKAHITNGADFVEHAVARGALAPPAPEPR